MSLFRAAVAVLLFISVSPKCDARLVQYDWTVSQTQAAYDGVTSPVYTINGKPGSDALIEATLGDKIQVRVTNALPNTTTALH